MNRVYHTTYPIFSRLFLTLFFFIVIPQTVNLFGQDSPFPDLPSRDMEYWDTGLKLLSQGTDSVWAGDYQLKDIDSLLTRAETIFKSVENLAARNYLLARVEFNRGRAVLMQSAKIKNHKKTQARASLEKAMELAQESLNLHETADCYRVMADAGATWMATRGLVGIIKMAPKVKEWSDRALAINPNNALAEIISSQGKIHAPKSSGGNPQEAVNRITALIARSDLERIERFRSCSVLIQAYKKIRDKENAEIYCGEAKTIFPDNIFIDQLCQN